MRLTLNHFSDLPIIETNRLILKPLNKEFLSQNYVTWMNDKDVNRYLESGGDYTLEKLNDYLKEVERNPKYFWAITTKLSSKHIGNIKIDPINYDDLRGEYGILIGDKNFWGMGLAEESSIVVLNFCFKVLKLNQIELGVLAENSRAISLYKKIGFSFKEIKNKNIYRMIRYNSL